MTERQVTLATQNAITAPAPVPAPPVHAPVPPSIQDVGLQESVDEEPYTIKCICDYPEDDGNTIYCETCDTWQHIECFYPGRVEDAAREDFDHSCADCKPRQLDRRHATEHQRQQRQNNVAGNVDKKSKRQLAKSHKKKPKPSELPLNGHDPGAETPLPAPKKSKAHRPQASVGSVKRSPPPPPKSRTPHPNHPLSPLQTPPDVPLDFQLHGYSDTFATLYDNDDKVKLTEDNSFASLAVTNSVAIWRVDGKQLEEDAGVENPLDVFQKLIIDPATLVWPELRLERRVEIVDGVRLQWRWLEVPAPKPISERIGRLTGHVGFQSAYCKNPTNRWQLLSHPRPFVFFHPRLPICIDTRSEGSVCRYVRRSCRPNTTLDTFVTAGSGVFFWLISERAIKAREQVTIAWDFRFHKDVEARYRRFLNLNLGDEDGACADEVDISEEEYQHLSQMTYLALSDHGGCACDLGPDCAFARFHRHYYGRFRAQQVQVKAKRPRKTKHVSPTSTGHATNSRAASEQQEHHDDDDAQSVAGSARSKPHSRDITPAHGSVEVNGILTETTDREKRKLAALEDSFRKMEQGQPPRKKKRASDGASPVVPNAQPVPKARTKSVASRQSISHSPLPNGSAKSRSQYVDASTSRRQSGSPLGLSPVERQPAPSRQPSQNRSSQSPNLSKNRANYADASTQTDAIEHDWYSPRVGPARKRKSIVSLSQRLLRNRLKNCRSLESLRTTDPTPLDPQVSPPCPSPSGARDTTPASDRRKSDSSADIRAAGLMPPPPAIEPAATVDVSMPDAPPVVDEPNARASPAIEKNTRVSPAPASTPATTLPAPRAVELRVTMPPTARPVGSLAGTAAGAPITPSSATSVVPQSPFGTSQMPAFSPILAPTNGGLAIVAASPVKKKITLSDYNARMKRNDAAHATVAAAAATTKNGPGTSPSMSEAVLPKPSPSTASEVATKVLEGSPMLPSPEGHKGEGLVEAVLPQPSMAPNSTTSTTDSAGHGVVNGGN